MPKPAVLHSPEVEIHLKRGFDTMANALAVTLGPTQGIVLSEAQNDARPEILSDAATIARRILALPDRSEDVGAMLLRNLVWRMQLKAGDGCATAAVLAQAIFDHAYRYKTAGANAVLLQRGLKRAAEAALEKLRQMAQPVGDEEDLSRVAETITAEPDLSLILGEMFDILGPEAYINIEDYVAPYLEREYQEGGRWAGRLSSPYLITDPARRRAMLTTCPVALYAGPVSAIDEVEPLLQLAAQSDRKRLVLLAHEIKGAALTALVANHQQKKVQTIAVELRRPAGKRRTDFEDLAVLTGATILGPEIGRPLATVKATDLGLAKRAEADADSVVLVGDPQYAAAVRQQIEQLQVRIQGLPPDDEALEELRFRLARLSGHVATLKIGAFTKAAREAMRQKAGRALRALPLALQEGVAPGGGVAYLDCIPAVKAVEAHGEEAWGVDILAQALEAPFRRIVTNAGVDSPATVLAEIRRQGAGTGYDALRGQIVNMAGAGILDAVGVLRLALMTAVSGATMALSTETIIHKRRPQTSLEP
jgi:chaperonin GroEL